MLRWLKIGLWGLGAVILAFGVLIYSVTVREPSPIPFDQQVWQSSQRGKQTRHAMLKDLIEKHALVGMSRADTERLLGAPDRTSMCWYRLGPEPGLGIDDIWLELSFDNDTVVRHALRHD